MRPCDDFSDLLAKLKQGSQRERLDAIDQIRWGLLSTPDTLAALKSLVGDGDGQVQRAALLALFILEPEDALPYEIVRDKIRSVEEADDLIEFFEVFRAIFVKQPEVVLAEVHRLFLHDEESLLSYAANVVANTHADLDAKLRLLPALIGCLRSSHSETRLEAVIAIAGFGSAASAAVPVLAELCDDSSLMVRDWAYEALAEIGSASRTALPTLIRRLDTEAPDRIFRVAEVIERIGLEDDRFHPAFYRALGCGDTRVIDSLIRTAERVRSFNEEDVVESPRHR